MKVGDKVRYIYSERYQDSCTLDIGTVTEIHPKCVIVRRDDDDGKEEWLNTAQIMFVDTQERSCEFK